MTKKVTTTRDMTKKVTKMDMMKVGMTTRVTIPTDITKKVTTTRDMI